MSAKIAERVKVVDCDTHVFEPDDVWTSRVSKKWGDLVPHIKVNPNGNEQWYFGDEVFTPQERGIFALAGWNGLFPDHPATIAEVDKATWDPHARLKKMDEYGIYAQILYPNAGGFGAAGFIKLKEPELMLECVRAYNDFLSEWASADPKRLVPLMAMPFWDVDACVKEMHRAYKNGHKGIVFGNQTETFGFPMLADPHWNPIWENAQDLGLSINFHIGTGDGRWRRPGHPASGAQANFVKGVVMEFLDNSHAIGEVIVSGMCHRYPKLNFVSVESGAGYLPFLLEALDWQWQNTGGAVEHPDRMLPSEYFRRQVYGCFWFERKAQVALDDLADNLLYETDFPHPTSMAPGPSTPKAIVPSQYIDEVLGFLPEEKARKILHDNAARIYQLD